MRMVTLVVRLADLEFLSPRDLSGGLSTAGIIEAIRQQFDYLPGELHIEISEGAHVGFKRLAPEQDTGMDLDAPFLTALELFQGGDA
jgi:hypothetical protein